MRKRCVECGAPRKKHGNAKYCEACAKLMRHKTAVAWTKLKRKQKDGREVYLYAWKKSNWKRLGILDPPTLEVYSDMVAEAKKHKRCPVCKRKNKGRWALHHDHKTGKWFGLICHRCNVGMGQFNDDYKLLRRASKWLRKQK